MDINLTNDTIEILLEPMERLWSAHLSQRIKIPLESVQAVELAPLDTAWPGETWRELRAPGTHVPGLIKAGTYYTERGREFWYVLADQTRDQSCLRLEMAEGYYKRVVLGLAEPQMWRSRIQAAIAEQKPL